MPELLQYLVKKSDETQEAITDIKTILTRNTADLEYHIKRTDDLQIVIEEVQKMINPLFQDYIGKLAVEEFKKEQKSDLLYKLKLPGIILGLLTALGTLITWFVSK